MSAPFQVTSGIRVNIYDLPLNTPYSDYMSCSDKYDVVFVDEEIAQYAYKYLTSTHKEMKLYLSRTTIFGVLKNSVSILAPIEEAT